MIASTGRNGDKMVICVDMPMPTRHDEDDLHRVAEMHMLSLQNEADTIHKHMAAIMAGTLQSTEGAITDRIKDAAKRAAEAAKAAKDAMVKRYKKATEAISKAKPPSAQDIEVTIPQKYLDDMDKVDSTLTNLLVTMTEVLAKLAHQKQREDGDDQRDPSPNDDGGPTSASLEGPPMFYIVRTSA